MQGFIYFCCMNKQLDQIFEKELLDEIYGNSTTVNVNAGDTVLNYGQNIRQIPIVTEGSLKVLREDEEGRELLLYYVSASETCAMTFTCCMEQQTSEIKAIAEEDSELMLIPSSIMDQWIMKYPTWKSFVMRTVRARFHELLQAIDHIAFEKLDDRLVNYLKEKSKATGSTLINLSHQEIANEMASNRVVISRLLKKLENDKKVILYRHQIKLLNDL